MRLCACLLRHFDLFIFLQYVLHLFVDAVVMVYLVGVQVTGAAARVGCAINEAVQELIGEGTLPEACYPAAQVKKVSPKQRCILGPQAAFTSAAAFPIAAAARRASGD